MLRASWFEMGEREREEDDERERAGLLSISRYPIVLDRQTEYTLEQHKPTVSGAWHESARRCRGSVDQKTNQL